MTAYSDTCNAEGIGIEGGPTEVSISAQEAAIVAHGARGLRTIVLPGNWRPREPIPNRNGRWVLQFNGGQPARILFDAFR